MNGLRKVIGLLMVTIFAAFALPAIAHGDDEKFTLVMAPASVPGGAQTITATLATLAGDDDRIKSFKLITPPGVTQLSVTSTSPAISTTNIQIVQATATAAGSVSVKNVNLSRSNRTVVLTLSVTLPPAACVSASYSWSAKAWEESNYSDGQYAGPAAGSQLTTTVAGGGCNYSLTGIPTTVTAGTTPSATVTLSNSSSSTSITSFSLTPPSGLTVALVGTPPTGVSFTAPNTITISSVAANSNVSFGITLTSATSCAAPTGGGNWTQTPVPASFSGNQASTAITASSCTLSFATQPKGALTGKKITTVPFDPTGGDVTVQALINGSPASGVSVTVEASTACAIGNGTASTVSGIASFSTLTGAPSTTTTCALTAKATAAGFTNSAASNSFDIVVGAAGVLGCSTGTNQAGGLGSKVLNQSGFEGTPDWGLVRGQNWNPDTCTLVPYTFTFDAANGAAFIAGSKGTQQISAEYVLLFNPVPVSEWPNFHPKVAWANPAGIFPRTGATIPVHGTTDYVNALACLDDDVNGTSVLPTITASSDPTYAAAVAAGNTQYTAGNLALMCVANMGWTSIGGTIQPWYKIIDRSDGWSEP